MSLISILGVTLAVLKVIGKIILIILAVILAIILLVLFLLSLPFSYEAGGYVDTANMKKTDVTLKFKYCFGLILNAIAEYKKKKLKILVKVFFFTVMKKCIGGKKKEKEDAEGSTSAESTESTESSESSESEGDVSGEANGSADSEALSESDGADNADGKATGESEGSDSTKDGPKGENFNEGMDLEDEISEEEADLEEEEAELEGKVSEAESREEGAYANEAYANEAYANEANDVEAESPENSERAANEEPGEIVKEKKELGEKLDEIADKLDEVGDKIDAKVAGIEEKYSKFERIKNAIVEIIEDEKFFMDIAFFKKHLLKILKAFLPKKIEGWLDYGMADPATTGKITAILGMLYGMYAENFDFTPDFETDITYVRGEFKLKGCFCLIYILGQLLRMVFSFHFIRVFKRYKKIMAAVNGEEPKKAKGQ
jgi:hypothetical protein